MKNRFVQPENNRECDNDCDATTTTIFNIIIAAAIAVMLGGVAFVLYDLAKNN